MSPHRRRSGKFPNLKSRTSDANAQPSGFKPSDSLSISVSQNALTAGPVNVPAWGGGGGGGTISIAVERTLAQIAPDSIRFTVDLSKSTFDTAGPSGTATYYDPRLHDLIYLWDLGDPGTWDAPVNVLASWKNRNVAKGPSVRHIYRDPDDYIASVLVVEPSTGKTATASVNVTVDDPQDYYGDTNTIYVNNIGDSDFSGVPAGVPSQNKVNIDTLQKLVTDGTDPQTQHERISRAGKESGGVSSVVANGTCRFISTFWTSRISPLTTMEMRATLIRS